MFTVRTTAFEKAKSDASASAAVEAVNSEDMAAAQVTTLKSLHSYQALILKVSGFAFGIAVLCFTIYHSTLWQKGLMHNLACTSCLPGAASVRDDACVFAD